jgi:hypothetical protein
MYKTSYLMHTEIHKKTKKPNKQTNKKQIQSKKQKQKNNHMSNDRHIVLIKKNNGLWISMAECALCLTCL